MDCAEGLARLPAECIDLVVTSPPYDELRTYDDVAVWTFDKFKSVAAGLVRALKPGGVIVWVVGDQTINGSETGSSYRQCLHFKDICGLRLHDTMLYEKPGSSHPASRDGNRYTNVFEFMFIFSKGRPKSAHLICDQKRLGYFQRGKERQRKRDGGMTEPQKRKDKYRNEPFIPRNNIWRILNSRQYGQSDKRAYEHPATFPEQLAHDHIVSWSNDNDLVCDPFAGSGTVWRMAHATRRRFIGFEINETYCALARDMQTGLI